ncbi:MAG TPA: hypothetical protein VI299_13085 [Polyangiales bacterium]
MMRRLNERELAREPARPLADAPTSSAEAIAAEVLSTFASDRFTPEETRELVRRYWRALALRRGRP